MIMNNPLENSAATAMTLDSVVTRIPSGQEEASMQNDEDDNLSLNNDDLFSRHKASPPPSFDDSVGRLMFQQSMVVDQSWEKAKKNNDTSDDEDETCVENKVGEQIVRRMMDLDPSARSDMRISSTSSVRYTYICQKITKIIDLIVSLLGPELEEFDQELHSIGEQCRSEGIKIELLAEVVPLAVVTTKNTLQHHAAGGGDSDQELHESLDWTANSNEDGTMEEEEAWRSVMEYVCELILQ